MMDSASPQNWTSPDAFSLTPVFIKIHFVRTGANISLLLGRANELETPIMMMGWVLKSSNGFWWPKCAIMASNMCLEGLYCSCKIGLLKYEPYF